MAAACEVLTELGAADFVLPVNNRKLIDALLESCGITDIARQKHVLRVVDKLAKVGMDNIRRELAGGRIDVSGDPIPGVGLEEATIDRILAFIGIEGANRAETVEKLAQALPESKLTDTALAEMRELDGYLTALGVSEDHARFVPSLARGLDYYTGPVFEITFPKVPEVGSCGGGGRYDGLVDRFLNRPVPAAGFSFGIERLMAALEKSGVAFDTVAHAQVLVVTMGKVEKAETLRVAQELRQAGFCTEAFFASKKKMQMGNQLAHADHYGIPLAVILGEEEVARGEVAVKDLREGKAQREGIQDREAYREAGTAGQVTVNRAEMADTVGRMLKGS
jgi:histidyl-tRNA synthetase